LKIELLLFEKCTNTFFTHLSAHFPIILHYLQAQCLYVYFKDLECTTSLCKLLQIGHWVSEDAKSNQT